TLDFVEGLPKSSGFSVILVVVDRLSKSVHFKPLKHPFTTASVATAFVREIVRLHGMTPFKALYGRDHPRVVTYDQGTAVTAEVDQYLKERDRILADLRVHYNRAQQLKRVIGTQQVVNDLPDVVESGAVLIPDTVCGSRVNEGRREVLIAWKGMPVTEATWESFDEMRQQFPDFHLEDKVSFLGGGDDADQNQNQERWGQ
nr:hypothetical protein [Tanacetum cinerariifolium]